MQFLKSFVPLLVLLVTFTASAQSPSIPVPAAPEIGAKAYILMDYHSGKVVAEKNADEHRDPASLTKLMTAYVVFSELEQGHINLDDKVLISEHAWRQKGSRMFVEVGKRVTVNNLIKGMIIQSGNDASVALAEYVAGTESTFAQVMNQYAEQLGMTNTHYTNATGLPGGDHYTSARDTAILARALIRNFPEYYKYYSMRSFKWNGIEQYNRNKLLWRNPDVDGLKTGYTEDAGYNLTSSAKENGMRLISVVLGADSEAARVEQSDALLSYGFRFFQTHRLYKANEALTRSRVWKGASDTVPLGVSKDLYVTVPERQYDQLKASMSIDSRIMAPVKQGKQYGTVTVTLNGKQLAQSPLIALDSVDEGGLWSRTVDDVMLMFQ
ncbi:MAG TPA: D-alanyl-D-alanine carboxypeptidase family protein [Gammaproteobacteria bacterium]|nr:D-alanyl-D-alanine carboxypeptidase family protein [Gammaproteobacteria bacterium]